MTIRPGPDPTQEPRYHEMASGQFERLCARLAAEHFPEIDFGGQFEPNAGRKPQFGVDFRFETATGGTLVGSCRADEDPAKQRIVSAVTEFTNHWESKWKHESIERFVLCLGAAKLTDLRWHHIKDAKQEVERLGIPCDVWVPPKITKLLRDHRQLVRAMLHMYEEQICGPYEAQQLATTPRDLRSNQLAQMVADLETELEAVADTLDQSVRLSLDKLEERDRQGELRPLLEVADQYISDQASWNALSGSTKGRLLRAKAIGHLRSREFSEADALRKEAAKFDAPKDRYFEAVIKFREAGAKAALKVLGTPVSLREHTLAAALRVTLAEHDAAINLLDGVPTSTTSDFECSEVDRVRGFVEFSRANHRLAVAHSEAALKRDSTNRLAKLTLAASCYALSLAPAARLSSLSWPEPVPSALVRQNAEAVSWRSRAYELFGDLQRSTDDPDDQCEMALWRFACLLDLYGRQWEAQSIFDQSLADQHIHAGFIVWAIVRHVPFDRQAVAEKTEARLATRPDEIETRVAALWLLAELEGAEVAKARLIKEKCWFDDQGAERVYEHWLFQFGGGLPEASNEEEDVSSSGLRRLVSVQQAAEANEPDLPIATFSDHSLPVAVRLEAAEALTHLAEWETLWSHSEFLVTEIGTAAALQIAACAAVHAASGTDAERFIKTHADKICDDQWPTEINRYYAYALQKAGKPNEALEFADKLAASGAPEVKTFKADLFVQVGNLGAAALYLREAISKNELVWDSPFKLIRWTQILMGEDPDLARKCIRRLRETGYEGLEGDAFFLALSLLPKECDDFAQAFYKSAHAGTGKSFVYSFDEFVEFIKADHKHGQSVEDLLWDAKIPGHYAFGKKLGVHRLAPFVDQDARVLSLAFSPSRPGVELVGFEEIILDLTSLLTIQALDLWDKIVQLPHGLRIANSSQTALLELEREASPKQPNLVEETQSFLSLIEKGIVRVLKQRPKSALHLYSGDRSGSKGSVPVQEFVEAWLQDPDAACTTFFKSVSLKNPTIWLDYASLKALSEKTSLQDLANDLNIRISIQDEAMLRGQVREAEIGNRVAKSLESLRKQVSEYIQTGRIELTPAARPERGTENQIQLSMTEILKSAPRPQSAVWIDDRFLNAHNKVEHAPVITCLDILSGLENAEIISVDDHDEALYRLRNSGALFVPPTACETVRALAKIDCKNGLIEESPALVELRRSFASLFLFESRLSLSAGGRAHPGELRALIDAFRLAGSTISQIWNLDVNDEAKHAYIRWVATAYRFESSTRLPIENKSELADRRLRASWLFSILMSAYDTSVIVSPEFETALAPRVSWILSNVAELEWDADKQLRSDVIEMLGSFLAESRSDESKQHLLISRLLAGRFIELLPKAISDELFEHEELARFLVPDRLVTINGNKFSGTLFWKAAHESARSGRKVSCSSLANEDWELLQDGDDMLVERKDTRLRFYSPAIAASGIKLKADRSRRFRALLEQNGFRRPEALSAGRELAGIKSPAELILCFDDLIESMTQHRIAALHEAAIKRGSAPVELFIPPKPKELVYYVGFQGDDIDIDAAAKRLEAQVGLEEAVRRWLQLPVDLPLHLRAKTNRLAVAKRNAMFDQLVSYAHSPVSAINLAKLSAAHPEWSINADAIKEEFVNSLIENMGAFFALLRWSRGHASRSSTAQSDYEDLGAWLWAGAVFSTFGGGRRNLSELATILEERIPKGPADLSWSVKLGSRLDPNNWAQLALQASLVEAFGYKGLIKGDAELETKLKREFSYDEAAKLPKIDLFLCPPVCEEAFAHWLPERPFWVLDAIEVDDAFTRNVFVSPEETASSMVAEYTGNFAEIDQFLPSFAILAPHLHQSNWDQVAAFFKRASKKASAAELHLMAKTLAAAPWTHTQSCLKEFAIRLANCDPDAPDSKRAALGLLECVYTVAVRSDRLGTQEFFDWLDQLVLQLEWAFGFESVALLDVIASSIPSKDRPRLTKIRSRVAFASRLPWSQEHWK